MTEEAATDTPATDTAVRRARPDDIDTLLRGGKIDRPVSPIVQKRKEAAAEKYPRGTYPMVTCGGHARDPVDSVAAGGRMGCRCRPR